MFLTAFNHFFKLNISSYPYGSIFSFMSTLIEKCFILFYIILLYCIIIVIGKKGVSKNCVSFQCVLQILIRRTTTCTTWPPTSARCVSAFCYSPFSLMFNFRSSSVYFWWRWQSYQCFVSLHQFTRSSKILFFLKNGNFF